MRTQGQICVRTQILHKCKICIRMQIWSCVHGFRDVRELGISLSVLSASGNKLPYIGFIAIDLSVPDFDLKCSILAENDPVLSEKNKF